MSDRYGHFVGRHCDVLAAADRDSKDVRFGITNLSHWLSGASLFPYMR